MIVESEFFYDGMRRWDIGWTTPNYAGAFLVTGICLVWVVRGSWRWILIGLLVEAVVSFLLCKTYSRGALVALVAAAVYFLGAMGLTYARTHWRIWALRLLIVVICVFATGLIGRIRPEIVASDGAVTNRLDLWKGGLMMVAAAPLQGWGSGESGRAYMNWFQELDRTEGYTTMVNSYLHVAVEYGVWFLVAIFTGLFAFLMVAWRNARLGDATSAVAGASLMAWAVANVFTTLWIEPFLWIVPSLALTWIVLRGMAVQRYSSSVIADDEAHAASLGARAIFCPLASALGLALFAGGLLWGTGVWLSSRLAYEVTPAGEATVLISADGSSGASPSEVHLWIDRDVLGRTPGMELRRWFEQATIPLRLHVHRTNFRGTVLPPAADDVFLFGDQAARMTAFGTRHRMWLVHPSVPPPRHSGEISETILVLPEIDETGLAEAWRKWASRVGARVVVARHVGQDIRSIWPAIMEQVHAS